MRSNLRCAFAVLFTLAFPAVNASAQDKLPGGGVADPAGKTGFFPGAKGGVDALDLASGKLLWHRDGGNRPLHATINRLFVQKGAAVEFLDTADNGKLVLEAKTLGFPDWVSVDVAYGRTFRSSVRVEGKTLFLSWEARAFYAGGAPPPPEVIKAAEKAASGVARVNLETGKIEPLDADKIAVGKFFPLPTEGVKSKVGGLTLTLKDDQAPNTRNPFQKRRMLQALNAANEIVWERAIAAPVFLPPKP